MNIEQIVLQVINLPMREPFETSFGKNEVKEFILLRAYGNGEVGYGESTAMVTPFYNEETTGTIHYMLDQFMIPMLLKADLQKPEQVSQLLAPIRRNNMAKATLEGAVWDLYCKQQDISLAHGLGGERTEIESGISLGIEATVSKLLEKVEYFLGEGYKKIKVKVKPGWDLEPLQAIRDRFGSDVLLMADANSAYTLKDLEHLKMFDQFDLLMIEQPLAHDDIIDHAVLQREMQTPICLDESIHSVEDARKAIQLGSCKIINIKVGRMGGLTESKKLHDYCQSEGIPVWCGGMFEAGVGRAHNIAITSLSNFTIPGDTAVSRKYWDEDIIVPEVEFSKPGILAVPQGPGIGYELNEAVIQKYLVHEKAYKRELV